MGKKKTQPVQLSASDYEPLLVAISSRAVDTCLMGARCLALLEDPRAFGLLMQLSREDDPAVRLETCRSFAQLRDRRAVDRLCTLLADEDQKVRDAAFTALEKISAGDLLVAAENGLASTHEDVRRRGLEVLVRFVKQAETKKANDAAAPLLQQAICDPVDSVRSETFKFILNSKFGGGQDATLRFLLRSVHADIRREVLNEVIAEERQLWSETMMLEMLSDSDQGIRGDAFVYLQKKYDKGQTGWLSEAVNSMHVDIRKRACQQLIKIGTASAQAGLVEAINDSDSEIRQLVLESLVAKGAIESLVTALDSGYPGIQLAAAKALAQVGDLRCQDVLLKFAGQEWPKDSAEQQKVWETQVCQALIGLAQLGDSDSVEFLVTLCQSDVKNVRLQAATALKWTACPDSLPLIQPLLQHEDDQVRSLVAIASSLHGDLISARQILAEGQSELVEASDRLMIVVALNEETERQLVQMLDWEDASIANVAMIVLLCQDWLQHDGTPRRIVSALAARDARIRLIAAKALQAFSQPGELANVIQEIFNDRADDPAWKVAPEIVRQVAEMLVFSKPPIQGRAISLLANLEESKQRKWDYSWQWFITRFEKELEDAAQIAEKSKLSNSESEAVLDQLAFGTYVGLAREQGGYHFHQYRPRFGWSVEHVRCAALKRLAGLAKKNDEFLQPAISVVTHTCGDPLAVVSLQAFEILNELGVEPQRRAEIGIASGRLNLAVLGLTLITSSGTAAKRKSVLTDAILNQRRGIALEAAKMLRLEIGSVKACRVCLDSSDERVANQAVSWVAEDYEESEEARKLLKKLAADSSPEVQAVALNALVNHKDESAFGSIQKVLLDPSPKLDRQQCYNWLGRLGGSDVPMFLMELLDQPELDVDPAAVLEVVGGFRDAAVVPQLLKAMERKHCASPAIRALTRISGFDQSIQDPNDRWPDRDWMQGEHPRNGEVLARLLESVLDLGITKSIKTLIPLARWCLTDEVDGPLGRLVAHPDDAIRNAAIDAIAFRARKRDGSVEALKSAVKHRDPMSQYLAAEGLAIVGEDDGLQVLMSAIELLEDLRLRRRAVLALGHLSDERSLDLLLKLVTQDAHALQDSAAEAIGRLGDSSQKEKIFGILKKLVAQEGTAGQRAIVGLRHLNTPLGWDVIRSKAKTNTYSLPRAVVIEQLGYDSSSTTQDLLVDLLERFPNDQEVQLSAARRSFGADSVVPDVAFLKGQRGNQYPLNELESECLERVCQRATPAQIFKLISGCPNMARPVLTNCLLFMESLPVKEAVVALEDVNAPTVELAARVLGRTGEKKYSKKILAVLDQWYATYVDESQRLLRQNETPMSAFYRTQAALKILIWAAGRVGGAESKLLEMVTTHSSNAHFAVLRTTAIEALRNAKITGAMEKQLVELLNDFDANVRVDSARMLVTKTKSSPAAVAENLLSDRRAFQSVANLKELDMMPALQQAARSAHYQPRALAGLAKAEDVKTLAAVAGDMSLDVNSRLGAIEGLAKIINEHAEEALVQIGKTANLEGLRKAAWRGLRRSRRAGAKKS